MIKKNDPFYIKINQNAVWPFTHHCQVSVPKFPIPLILMPGVSCDEKNEVIQHLFSDIDN